MQYYFASDWSNHNKRVLELWSPTRAEDAHYARKKYTVVAGDILKPCAFISFWETGIGVSFLDKLLRVWMNYTFDSVRPNRLFLSMGTTRRFDGDTDKVLSGESYIFKPTGLVYIRENDIVRKELLESQRMADVSGNWENYPEFGRYESLLRTDRNKGPTGMLAGGPSIPGKSPEGKD